MIAYLISLLTIVAAAADDDEDTQLQIHLMKECYQWYEYRGS